MTYSSTVLQYVAEACADGRTDVGGRRVEQEVAVDLDCHGYLPTVMQHCFVVVGRRVA